jgi:3,4-dihydroxy-2-butanone 4-phosphate synthase
MADFQLNTIEEALQELRAGRVIIVVDDEDRENEVTLSVPLKPLPRK